MKNTKLAVYSIRPFNKEYHILLQSTNPGLMMESEKKIFEMLDERHPMAKYWLPLTWATNVINRARREQLISCDHLVQTILYEMSDIRLRLGSLIGYDNVNVPLVYTQVMARHLHGVCHTALTCSSFSIVVNLLLIVFTFCHIYGCF
ncbi:hypothetical protein J6590_039211 [Homalodisca vitripennis]|nr:hypothetical protein J6590_039211 [Homalodisca vitripennis]